MAEASSGGEFGGYSRPFAIATVALWASLNVTFNFFNSYVLRLTSKGGYGFAFPFFYSGCHMIASFVGVNIIFAIKPDLNTLRKEQVRKHWLPLLLLSVLMVLNIGCNNASLVYIGLSVNQIIKSITPLPTMCLSYTFGKKRYGPWLMLDVVIQVLGAILAVPYGDNMAEPLGLLMVFISMLAAASKPVVAGILMKDMKESGLTPLVLVWYDSLLSIFWLFGVSLCTTERTDAPAFILADPRKSLLLVGAGSCMALGYNIVVFYLTKVTSALTNVVLANIKQVVVISFSAILIDRISRWYNIVGLVIFFLASFVYSFLTLSKPAAASRPAAAPAPAKIADSAPTERTDLLKK